VFDNPKPFQDSIVFMGKVGANPSETPFRCPILGYSPGLTLKH